MMSHHVNNVFMIYYHIINQIFIQILYDYLNRISQINMGNTYNQEIKKGYRILTIEPGSPAQQSKMQVLLDYIIQPEPNNISLTQQNVQLQIYSITEKKIRSVNVHLNGKSLGVTLRLQNLNQCILKVVNVLKGSPFQKHSIKANQDYIIGMIEHSYFSLKNFIKILKSQIQNQNSIISLGVFNNNSGLRIVKIEIKQLLVWKEKGKGILGCELAEGWVHRIPKVVGKSTITKQQKDKNKLIEIQKKQENTFAYDKQLNIQQNQFENRIKQLHPELFVQQKKYKGILRCKLQQDSMSFCKCLPINKYCESCNYQKQGIYYFYCKKINKVFAIPQNMLFNI